MVYNSSVQSVTGKMRKTLNTSHITFATKGSENKYIHTCLLSPRRKIPVYTLQDPFLGDGNAHNGLDLPLSMTAPYRHTDKSARSR